MRTKQIIFLVLSFLFAFGVGVFGFWFGSNAERHNQEILNDYKRDDTFSDYKEANKINTVFAPKEVYQDFFNYPRFTKTPSGKIVSLVLPHHLVAGNFIAGVFDSVKNLRPPVVVIIGPNHYGAGKEFILSSKSDWVTQVGILEAHSFLIDEISKSNLIGLDDNVFLNEHSIGVLAPFVKKTWPETKVVPLVVKNIKNDDLVDGLAAKLYQVLPTGSLVIASVDFSHYLPKSVADFHDDFSINVLATGDLARVKKMEIDSQNSIRVLLKYNEISGAKNFSLAFHTNSADILKSDLLETTSHVMGYFSAEENKINSIISLQFFGDMMLERSVEKNFGADGLDYIFKNLRGQENRFFYGADLLLANLEGPFAPSRVKTTKSIAFRFDPKLASQLKKYGFSGFSLANNHTLDMGFANYDFTRSILDENNIFYFGHQTKEGVEYIYIAGQKEYLPEKIAFLGFNNTDHPLNLAKVREALDLAKEQARYVIVYMHWGNEYQRISHTNQREFGRWLIDNGVTAVIGMHPHVIQEMEIYKNRPIFYSLGNFVFDQYFSKETQEGISVGLNLSEGEVKDIYVFPFFSVKSQNSLMLGDRQKEFFNWWNKNSRLEGKQFVDNKINLN